MLRIFSRQFFFCVYIFSIDQNEREQNKNHTKREIRGAKKNAKYKKENKKKLNKLAIKNNFKVCDLKHPIILFIFFLLSSSINIVELK